MIKKLSLVALTLTLVIGLMACTGPATTTTTPSGTGTSQSTSVSEPGASTKTPQDFETFKIGVMESQANDETVLRRAYYENYIGPKYNVEFVFSEQTKSTELQINFIENCVDLGCKAIISFDSTDAPQMSRICNEYGIYYAINTTRVAENEAAFISGYDTFQGVFGTEPADVAVLYQDWLENTASADGSEGFMITSALAFEGNTMHAECTQGVLSALQEKYGLTYQDSIENLAATAAPLEVPNDKGIRIYIYPGTHSTNESWTEGASAALQTGKYGLLLQSAPTFSALSVAVDEVEKGFNLDIKVASMGFISETLTNAFNTPDKFGNPSLNMAVIRSGSFSSALGFIQIYNALTGYASINKNDKGEPTAVRFPMWVVKGKEDVARISTWDSVKDNNWVFNEDLINTALGICHPDLTNTDLQVFYNSITYQWVAENMK